MPFDAESMQFAAQCRPISEAESHAARDIRQMAERTVLRFIDHVLEGGRPLDRIVLQHTRGLHIASSPCIRRLDISLQKGDLLRYLFAYSLLARTRLVDLLQRFQLQPTHLQQQPRTHLDA